MKKPGAVEPFGPSRVEPVACRSSRYLLNGFALMTFPPSAMV